MPRWMRQFGIHHLLASDTEDEEDQEPRAVTRGPIDDGTVTADDTLAIGTQDTGDEDDDNSGRPAVQPSALLGITHLGERGLE